MQDFLRYLDLDYYRSAQLLTERAETERLITASALAAPEKHEQTDPNNR
jgi:hypothetical protein